MLKPVHNPELRGAALLDDPVRYKDTAFTADERSGLASRVCCRTRSRASTGNLSAYSSISHPSPTTSSAQDAPASTVSFWETPSGGDYGWHQDPIPRLVFTLTGTLEFEVKNGRRFTIRPGDILFAEDTTGSGHKWWLLDDQPWRRAYVVVTDLAAVPFSAVAKENEQ